ncbi:MAG: MerR family DNA-binding transcriptional regulator [Hyphomicrobiaceae bacterium]
MRSPNTAVRARGSATPPETPATDLGAASTFSIGALAEEFHITTRAIRFYEARGLLSPARAGNARTYSRRDRARLMLILRGKNLGFTLEDIGEYLALYDEDPNQQAQTKLLLEKVERHITDLQQKRVDLERALGELKDIQSRCQDFLRGAGERAAS